MNDNTVDAVARHEATEISRRVSFLTLAGAALAATITGPIGTEAKKSGKKCKKQCKQQGAQCRSQAFEVCGGAVDPAACQEFFLPLCTALGRCNAGPLLRQVIVLA